eukprot:GFYU01022914.1.p1 GENE.GFYU01022914.1~~GFYU01022914.1.p1  ORF type:complete len:613 (-),score=40.62 GFYU01022914.1:71-1870(-)
MILFRLLAVLSLASVVAAYAGANCKSIRLEEAVKVLNVDNCVSLVVIADFEGAENEERQKFSTALAKTTKLQALIFVNRAHGSTGTSGIGDSGAAAVAQGLKGNISVRTIQLAGQNIRSSGAKDLFHGLESSEVRAVAIANNPIGNVGAQAAASFLRKNKGAVVELDMSHCSMDSTGVAAIGSALAINTGLKNLWLTGNESGDIGAVSIGMALTKNANLEFLALGKNSIQGIGAQGLAKGLATNKALVGLKLYENIIEETGAQHLSKALLTNKHLEVLDLGSTKIKEAGFVALSAALSKNTNLQELQLYSSDGGDAGVIALAESLSVNTALRQLSLFDNGITDIGATALAHMLAQNRGLTVLKLGENRITAAGGVAIAEACVRNNRLHDLRFQSNPVGDVTAAALARALKQHTNRLDELWLSKTGITDEGVMKIAEALPDNSFLRHLYLNGNPNITQASVRKFDDVLKTNVALTELEFDNRDGFASGISGSLRRNAQYAALLNKINQQEAEYHEKQETRLVGNLEQQAAIQAKQNRDLMMRVTQLEQDSKSRATTDTAFAVIFSIIGVVILGITVHKAFVARSNHRYSKLWFGNQPNRD